MIIDEIRFGFCFQKDKVKKELIMLKTKDKMRDIAKRGMGNVKSGIKGFIKSYWNGKAKLG